MYEAYIYRRSDTQQERDRVRFNSRKSSYPQGILRIAYEMARDNKSKAIAIDSLSNGIREPIQTAYWDRYSKFVKYHRTGRFKDYSINRLMSDGTVRLLEYGTRIYGRNELPPGCNNCVNNYITYNKTVINKPTTVVKKKVVGKKVVKRVAYHRGGGRGGGYDLGYAGAYRLPPRQPMAIPQRTRTVRTQDTTQVQLQREERLREKAQSKAELKKMRLQDKQERRKARWESKHPKQVEEPGLRTVYEEPPPMLPQGDDKALPPGEVIDAEYRIIVPPQEEFKPVSYQPDYRQRTEKDKRASSLATLE